MLLAPFTLRSIPWATAIHHFIHSSLFTITTLRPSHVRLSHAVARKISYAALSFHSTRATLLPATEPIPHDSRPSRPFDRCLARSCLDNLLVEPDVLFFTFAVTPVHHAVTQPRSCARCSGHDRVMHNSFVSRGRDCLQQQCGLFIRDVVRSLSVSRHPYSHSPTR